MDTGRANLSPSKARALEPQAGPDLAVFYRKPVIAQFDPVTHGREEARPWVEVRFALKNTPRPHDLGPMP
jgi:hypothetical protein